MHCLKPVRRLRTPGMAARTLKHKTPDLSRGGGGGVNKCRAVSCFLCMHRENRGIHPPAPQAVIGEFNL